VGAHAGCENRYGGVVIAATSGDAACAHPTKRSGNTGRTAFVRSAQMLGVALLLACLLPAWAGARVLAGSRGAASARAPRVEAHIAVQPRHRPRKKARPARKSHRSRHRHRSHAHAHKNPRSTKTASAPTAAAPAAAPAPVLSSVPGGGSESPTSTPLPVPAVPAVSATGDLLSWSAIPGVGSYVVASRVPGQAETESVVSETSFSPPVMQGLTASYSVRTDVEGSSWSPPVSISFPSFQPGVNAGWIYNGQLDEQAVATLGAKIVRVNFPIEWTASQLKATIAGYAALGVRVAPLALFDGRIPTAAEAKGLASWAKAYGPGGTFWKGRSDGALAIQTIEFGNETSGGYQYGDGAGAPSYMERARDYAVLVKEAAQSISAAGMNVGMLAVSEDWTGDWMNEMFSAVPNLGRYVAGWVSHPYGTEWKLKLENIIKQSASHGASSSIPIDVTEWGLSSDNGRCLSENYGYTPCMTYQLAGETLRSVFAEMSQLLGKRLGLFLLYQARDQAPSGTSTERESYFGVLQHELQPKGEFTKAVEEVLGG
jgi:hypothetical protein